VDYWKFSRCCARDGRTPGFGQHVLDIATYWRLESRQNPHTCIFRIVLLGLLAKASQAGVAFPPAGGKATVRAGTCTLSIRLCVMRFPACSARAHCPKLEPLLEHGDLQSPGLVSLQV
jgi:hypothetical protein